MGWTSYHAKHYKENGQIDIKAEIRHELFRDPKLIDGTKLEIVRDAVVGSTYFAAIKNTRTNDVWAFICLTQSDRKNYYNFYYKDMDETVVPGDCRCPVSILKELTPTDSKNANEWRKACMDYHEKKKSRIKLDKTKRYILRAKETINYKCGTIEKGKEVEIFRYRNKWVFLYSWNYCLAQLKYFDVVREVA